MAALVPGWARAPRLGSLWGVLGDSKRMRSGAGAGAWGVGTWGPVPAMATLCTLAGCQCSRNKLQKVEFTRWQVMRSFLFCPFYALVPLCLKLVVWTDK